MSTESEFEEKEKHCTFREESPIHSIVLHFDRLPLKCISGFSESREKSGDQSP